MTDDEKLAKIEALENGFWNSLDGRDSEWLHKNIASLERCQRIRANLKGPVFMFPESDNSRPVPVEYPR